MRVGQSGQPFGLEAGDPFARGARADACGSCGGLRRLPALDNCAHHALSTKRRQTGIVMDVHPVLRGITEASQLQVPRAEPDEQPIESSHLACSAAVPKDSVRYHISITGALRSGAGAGELPPRLTVWELDREFAGMRRSGTALNAG